MESQGIVVHEPLRRSKKQKTEDVPEDEIWYRRFRLNWNQVESLIQKKYEELSAQVLNKLVTHIKSIENTSDGNIPTDVLVTGSNLSDVKLLLNSLTKEINDHCSPLVATLWARDCSNLKLMIHRLVQQFLYNNSSDNEESSTDSDENDVKDDKKKKKTKLTSSQYNFTTLSTWKALTSSEKPLVVIIPEFESVNSNVLTEFLLALSDYVTELNIRIIFCLATSPSAVHQTLPHSAVSRLLIQIFYTEPSLTYLNSVLEEIIFTDKCPFKLGKKTITFLTDVFLFHTLSVQRFIQAFKYCMMEHFYKKNYLRICCSLEELEYEVKQLEHDDLENLRRITSFQKLIESRPKEERKILLLNDELTKVEVGKLLKNVHACSNLLYLGIRVLHIVTCDLPKSPLGKHQLKDSLVESCLKACDYTLITEPALNLNGNEYNSKVREFYAKCVSNNIIESAEYKECFVLARMQSRQELLTKVNKIVDVVNETKEQYGEELAQVRDNLVIVKNEIEKFENEDNKQTEEMATNFEDVRKRLFDMIEELIKKYLTTQPTSLPLSEVIYFDDVSCVKKTLSASPRNIIHRALSDPHYYLECDCCELKNNEDVLKTMPDLCIVFKLHLEHGKTIKLNDWLQAFNAVLEPDGNKEVSKEVQARFTKAISELQFLGYIKPSGEDHVIKLTWGKI